MGDLQRGHPLPMAHIVFAQGEQKRACPHGTKLTHKQTLTNNQSCQRKRDAVSHCATQLHCRQCHCSCEMVLQNPVLHFRSYMFQPYKMVLHFPVLFFSGPPFSALPFCLQYSVNRICNIFPSKKWVALTRAG